MHTGALGFGRARAGVSWHSSRHGRGGEARADAGLSPTQKGVELESSVVTTPPWLPPCPKSGSNTTSRGILYCLRKFRVQNIWFLSLGG